MHWWVDGRTTGILRSTSGLPFSLNEPGWTTDYQIESYAVVTDNKAAAQSFSGISIRKLAIRNSSPNAGWPLTAACQYGGPVRLPYPGEAGRAEQLSRATVTSAWTAA